MNHLWPTSSPDERSEIRGLSLRSERIPDIASLIRATIDPDYFLVPSGLLALRQRRGHRHRRGDPEFLADAKARQMEVEPTTGEALQGMVATMLSVPPELAKRAAGKGVGNWGS